MKMTFPNKTVGNGASFYWTGSEGNGNAITLKTKDGESIQQKMKYDGTEADVNWTFKDTLAGKTKVTWKASGTMSFLFKVYAALNGGSDKVIGTIYEKSLANIDKNLDYETKTYAIKVNGLVKKTETPYIRQTFTSEIGKVGKNAKIVIPKLIEFSKNNGLATNGKPFIIYHTYDITTGLAKISICLPTSREIVTTSGSDISGGKLNGFEAVKTTLKGDYSHLNEAFKKTTAFNTASANPSEATLPKNNNSFMVLGGAKGRGNMMVNMPNSQLPIEAINASHSLKTKTQSIAANPEFSKNNSSLKLD